MFTPARIFLALGTSAAFVLAASDGRLPWWLALLIGAFVAGSQVITAVAGPVQNSVALNAVATEAVNQAKADGVGVGGK